MRLLTPPFIVEPMPSTQEVSPSASSSTLVSNAGTLVAAPGHAQRSTQSGNKVSWLFRQMSSGSGYNAGVKKRSYTPFDSRATSAKPLPAPQLHNSDEGRAQLDTRQYAAHPAEGQHAQVIKAQLTATFKTEAALRRLGDKNEYRKYLNDTSLLPVDQKDEARTVLATVLDEISIVSGIAGIKSEAMQCVAQAAMQGVAMQCVAQAAMQGVAMQCVAQAALQVCIDSSTPAAAAARALCCLRNIDLLAHIRNPEEMPHNMTDPRIACPPVGSDSVGGKFTFNKTDVARAWEIATILETTPEGFTALKFMTVRPHDDGAVHSTILTHDDVMLHTYLHAAREKCKEASQGKTTRDPAPFSIIPDDGAVLDSVLDKGLHQIRKHLIASNHHTVTCPQEPFHYKVDPGEHEWAIGFIRNGLYSDKEEIGGEPTPFARIEGRINKMSTWCKRATSGGSGPAAIWNKASRFLMPGYRKSPLNAYNRLGEGRGANKTGADIGFAEQGILHDARIFKDSILGNLIKGLQASGDGGASLSVQAHGNPRNPTHATIYNLVRLALLTEVDKSTKPIAHLLYGEKPDTYTVDEARKCVYEWLDGGKAAQSADTVATIEQALKEAGQPLTLDRLSRWAAPLRAIPHDGGSWPAADWVAFSAAAEQLVSGKTEQKITSAFDAPGEPSTRLTALGNVIERAVAQQEIGSKLTLTSGGFSGVGAKEINQFLFKALTFGLVRPRVDASVVRKREAALEIETSIGGSSVFIGTRRALKVEGGAGVGVGVGARIKGVAGLSAGVSAEAFASTENQALCGVELCLTPVQSERLQGDPANNALLAEVIRKHVIERESSIRQTDNIDMAPEDRKSTLKKLLQDCPDLCVFQHGFRGKEFRAGMSVKGGATASLGPFSLGPAAGITYEVKQTETQNRAKSPGMVNIIGSNRSVQHTLAQSDGINALRQFPKTLKTLSGADAAGSATKKPPLRSRLKRAAGNMLKEMCVTSREIGKWGESVSDTLLFENGAILKQSRRTITHLTAESFMASVAPKLDQLAIAKANRFENKKMLAGGIYSIEAVENAYASLSAQLEDARTNAASNTKYTECFELTLEAADSANALRSALVVAERAGNTDAAAVYERQLDALLASETSWEPYFLSTQRTITDNKTTGMFFGLYAGITDSVATRNMKLVS